MRTLARWIRWWRKSFPQTAFWRSSRGRFTPLPKESALPASLLERFSPPGESERLLAMLRFLSPLTAGTISPMDR